MRVFPLASSSSGNAYVVETEGSAVLVDCGICYKHLKNIAVDAVLITHSHSDHISGLKTLLKHRDIPLYANVMTAEAVAHECGINDSAFVCFENGQEFEVGAFTASAFSIPHDTSDPVGYLLKADGETYFHGTDIGTPLDSIGLKFAEATIATLESNHDPVMLRTIGRPPYLIQRIAGPRGHLSTDQACELVRKFASPQLKKLYLAHLSRQCNSAHIAMGSMQETLKAIGRADIELEVAG